METNTKVSVLPLVGPYFAKRLEKLNIRTAGDLIYHVPHHYQDFSMLSSLEKVQAGEIATVQGQITKIDNIYTRRRKQIQKAVLTDGEQTIDVLWFNQPFLAKTIPAGTYVSLSGKVDQQGLRKILVSPQYEKLQHTTYPLRSEASNIQQPATIHTGRLVPIYPETYGISSKWLRARLSYALPKVAKTISDPLPEKIVKKYKLIPLSQALFAIHFPKSLNQAEEARQRLAFDELLTIQVRTSLRKMIWAKNRRARKISIDQEKTLEFIQNLPFALTSSQKRSIREILADMEKSKPMNRLLEGDVGSGKTVVAALACYHVALSGYKSALMAPTQILAMQHYKTIKTILEPFGLKVVLLTSGGTKKKTEGDVIIGTQTLIQKKISFNRLVLVVIDEQHRFGVTQRALLAKKGGRIFPHVLTMTATPIPRTVALTLYGDLDLSTLDSLPKNRIPIKTWVIPPQKREAAYRWIKKQVKDTDEQAFIVCPLIEQSEKESMKDVRAATVEFERLSKKVFTNLKLALLHGKIGKAEKEKIMDQLREGKIDILVATPVVEVGIDIPNATIMMIEGAERFGLAQLHQLRGRVGRGNRQSYCLLFSQSRTHTVLARLRALEGGKTGRELAEIDLRLRGPGEVYGMRQHGFAELKIGSFSDTPLIRQTREAAEFLVQNLKKFPKFKKSIINEDIAPN